MPNSAEKRPTGQLTKVERLRGRAAVEQRKRRLANEPLCRRCAKAGTVRAAVTPDHIVPLSKGGLDTDDNIQCLCLQCHDEKTREDFGWRKAARGVDGDGWPLP